MHACIIGRAVHCMHDCMAHAQLGLGAHASCVPARGRANPVVGILSLSLSLSLSLARARARMHACKAVRWWLARHSCMEATNAKRPAGASSTIHEPMMLLLLGRHGGPEGSHCITRGFVTRSDLHRNRRRPAGEVHRSMSCARSQTMAAGLPLPARGARLFTRPRARDIYRRHRGTRREKSI